MSRFCMLCSKKCYVTGVSIGYRVRCYSLVRPLVLERAPRRAQCSAYTTRAWIDDVSHLARLCLPLVSVSRRAKRRAVFHKPFPSPRWKRLSLEMICLTLPRWVHGQSNAGRNCATQSKMCAAKESRAYLSARSSTRCILAANCSIPSPLGITLVMHKSRCSKWRSVSKQSPRNAKEPDLERQSKTSPGVVYYKR